MNNPQPNTLPLCRVRFTQYLYKPGALTVQVGKICYHHKREGKPCNLKECPERKESPS